MLRMSTCTLIWSDLEKSEVCVASDLTVMGMEAFLAVSLSCCLAPPLITT